MSAATAETLLMIEDGRGAPRQQLAVMFGVSAGLHVLLLVILMSIRLPSSERPRSSYEVTLIKLPPAVQPVPERQEVTQPQPEPPAPPVPASPKPQAKTTPVKAPTPTVVPTPPAKIQPTAPRVAPAVKMAPPPPKLVETKPVPPAPPRVDLNETLKSSLKDLKDLKLTEAPKPAEAAPVDRPTSTVPAPTNTREDLQKVLNTLNVPPAEARPQAEAKKPGPLRATPPPSTVEQEIRRDLERQEQIAKAEPVRPAAPSKPAVVKQPKHVRSMPLPDAGPVANEYFSRVQRLISDQWKPVATVTTPDELEVVMKFRLHRDGTISLIDVERASDDSYYDDSARRALLAAQAQRLPAFPAGLAAAYLDVHFSFTIGGGQG